MEDRIVDSNLMTSCFPKDLVQLLPEMLFIEDIGKTGAL